MDAWIAHKRVSARAGEFCKPAGVDLLVIESLGRRWNILRKRGWRSLSNTKDVAKEVTHS